MNKEQRKPNIGKALLVGLVGGLAASWTMNRFQDVWLAVKSPDGSNEKETERGETDALTEDQDDTTVRAASAVSERLLDHKLTPEEKKIAGPAVHYAIGAAGGIAYCVASEFFPKVARGLGLPYGTAFWLVVDEAMVPLLRLSKGPTAYPPSTHIYALASHLVFGATIEGARRILRNHPSD